MSVLRVTILGSGSSGGVPRADGDWGACDPHEPRNRRSRCGLLLQRWHGDAGNAEDATTVLIDTAPELRLQLAAAGVRHIDAVLYTHDHADQTNGIDDLRAFYIRTRKRVRVHMDRPTRETLSQRFAYCFEGKSSYAPILDVQPDLEPFKHVHVHGPGGTIDLTPLPQDHGTMASLGFRFGQVAYSNDLVRMGPDTMAALAGLELWIVDALREKPHPTHAHLAQSLRWIDDLNPQRAVLTNLHVDLDYRQLAAKLPAGVEPAYDGWALDLTV